MTCHTKQSYCESAQFCPCCFTLKTKLRSLKCISKHLHFRSCRASTASIEVDAEFTAAAHICCFNNVSDWFLRSLIPIPERSVVLVRNLILILVLVEQFYSVGYRFVFEVCLSFACHIKHPVSRVQICEYRRGRSIESFSLHQRNNMKNKHTSLCLSLLLCTILLNHR